MLSKIFRRQNRPPGRPGFTLIELLVVVSIIAILSAIGLSVFTNAQRNARDARRRADLKQIQNAAEKYYLECQVYPASTGDFILTATGCAAGSGVAQYIQVGAGTGYPTDPRSGNTYQVVTASATAYSVCTETEINANGKVNTTWTAATGNDGNDTLNDVCVANLQ